MDFRVRNAFGHVPVTLCTKRRKFMDFEPKIARVHAGYSETNVFGSHSPPGSVQNDAQKPSKNAKSAIILDGDPTKIHEKSSFEHV